MPLALNRLTDEELIRHAEASFEPLAATELEQELLRRLTANADFQRDSAEMLDILEQHNTTPQQLAMLLDQFGGRTDEHDRMLDLLEEFEIDGANALRQILETHAENAK